MQRVGFGASAAVRVADKTQVRCFDPQVDRAPPAAHPSAIEYVPTKCARSDEPPVAPDKNGSADNWNPHDHCDPHHVLRESPLMHKIAAIVLVTTIAFCRSARALEPPAIAWGSDVAASWRVAQAEQRPLLIYVTSANCLYCVKMKQGSWQDPRCARSSPPVTYPWRWTAPSPRHC